MKYKLICIDIDGTLLDDENQLLPRVKKCLKDASAQGIFIALASGRMPAGIELIEKELEMECIKICNAGTYILMGKKCIGEKCLPNHIMKYIYQEIAAKYKIPIWIFRKEEWYVTGIDQIIEREIEIIGCRPNVADAEDLADKWDKEGKSPNKLLVAAEPDVIETIYQEIKAQAGEEIDMARSADIFLEIFPKGVSKGTALADICSQLDISLEETIAIGDQELDIPMVEAAGAGIAMGNAIAELKNKADFVTKTNNEAGVAYAVEYYLQE